MEYGLHKIPYWLVEFMPGCKPSKSSILQTRNLKKESSFDNMNLISLQQLLF
jgi:hypothetical protein